MPTDPYGGSPEPSDDGGSQAERQAEREAARQVANDAWSAFGLMISGVVVWGGAGYLVSRWTGHEVFTMVGLLVGMTTALYGIWIRYGRS